MVSGVLLGLSFPPFPFPFFAWIAFVPLLVSWNGRAEGRRAFLDAYLALLLTFGIAFQWPLFHEMPATALLSLPPLLVLPMWLALPFGVAHVAYRRCGTGAGTGAWLSLMVLAEYGLRTGPFAFPWTLIGHSQAEVASISRLAALGGVPLLSLVVLLANGAVFMTAQRSTRVATALAGLVLLAGAGIGVMGFGPDNHPQNRGNIRIAGIQPALSPSAWADLEDSSRVTLLLHLSRRAAADSSIDLIVWPETAIPPRPSPARYLDRLQFLADSSGIPILAGAITTGGGESAYRNSAILTVPRASPLRYDKVNLVPFAEQVPFAHAVPFLERFAVPAGGVSGYEPGENRKIFAIPGLQFGVLICFETLFGDAARAYALNGAEAIVAITQDGWWGDSFGYRQHLAFNRLRAIETGLPMIQAAATGISALIHPNGRIEEAAGWMKASVWELDVPPPSSKTMYMRYGDWVTALAALAALVVFGICAVRTGLLQRFKRPKHAT